MDSSKKSNPTDTIDFGHTFTHLAEVRVVRVQAEAIE